MKRFALVVMLAILIAPTALPVLQRFSAVGLMLGLMSGLGFYIVGFLRGGLPQPRLASAQPLDAPRPSSDGNAAIGTALAAAGIATAAAASAHYPASFRVFFGAVVFAGLALALVQAFRARNGTLPSTGPRKSSGARTK